VRHEGETQGERNGRKSIFAGEISEIADITAATSVAEPEQTRLKGSLEASRKRRFRAVRSCGTNTRDPARITSARSRNPSDPATVDGGDFCGARSHPAHLRSTSVSTAVAERSGAETARRRAMRSALSGIPRCALRNASTIASSRAGAFRAVRGAGSGVSVVFRYQSSVPFAFVYAAWNVRTTRTQRRQANASPRVRTSATPISRYLARLSRAVEQSGTQANLYIAQKEENS